MAEPTATPATTPKRKRGDNPLVPPIQFSFSPSQTPEDGSNSPRSKVAHRFRGLDITSGGGVEADHGGSNSESETRGKRQRPDEEMKDAATPTPEERPGDATQAAVAADADGKAVPQLEIGEEAQSGGLHLPEGGIQRAYPSINRLSESKSRIKKKKRSGTPPPRRRNKASGSKNSDEDEEMEIVEPVRAALTWREDEITIYDPEDPEDDGEGINGVGFKPTHALNQARIMKRKQQMAEYRKREEGEARAKRSQRRRKEERKAASSVETPGRKVQFNEEQNVAYDSSPVAQEVQEAP